ncbi:MAG: hypothetical protein QG565_644 [Campylobacterota bacterium]|nr:hypothetical protein [Campylobacterota bacterium]MDQ1268150.1 hypothetical protein [Campylobacterota bacterium]MDQ1337832.1 hypothetical protein [Campylobacterota bacterium]
MNRINPLYIAFFLIVFIGVLGVKIGQAKESLHEAKSEFQKASEISYEISKLRDIYDSKDKTVGALNAILKHSSLKSASLEQKIVAKKIYISSKSMRKSDLDFLISKLLNGSYAITALEIQAINQEEASLKMEIAL